MYTVSRKELELKEQIHSIELTDQAFTNLLYRIVSKKEEYKQNGCYGVDKRRIIYSVNEAYYGRPSSVVFEWEGSAPKTNLFVCGLGAPSAGCYEHIYIRTYGESNFKHIDAFSGKGRLISALVTRWLEQKGVANVGGY